MHDHHDHAHSHSAAAAGSKRLQIVLLLTAAYLVCEVAGAVITDSLALLADAGHVFIDVAGMTLVRVADLGQALDATLYEEG